MVASTALRGRAARFAVVEGEMLAVLFAALVVGVFLSPPGRLVPG